MWPTWRRRPGSLPELVPATQAALRQWIPDYLRVSNPVDNGGAPSIDWRGRKILDAIVADPDVAVLICPITGALPSMSRPLAEDLVAVAATTDKPICVIWGSPLTDDPAYAEVLLPRPAGVPHVRQLHRCGARLPRLPPHPVSHRSPFARPVGRRSPAAGKADALMGSGGPLSEHAPKRVLEAVQGPGHRRRPRRLGRRGRSAAGGLGYPVVMKATGADIAHKTEHGLVRLGVDSAAEARRAYAELVDAAGSDGDGVLVCETVTDGVETVVGIADDLFGPTIMFRTGRRVLEGAGRRDVPGPPVRSPHDPGGPRVPAAPWRPKRREGGHRSPRGRRDEAPAAGGGPSRPGGRGGHQPLLARADGAVALDTLVVTR